MTIYYHLPYLQLRSRTPWNGGMLADADKVTLDEAARFASKHAGTEITSADFLRAACRGQILLQANCPRTVTMEPCRGTDELLHIPEDSMPPLPLDACKALSNKGRAMWRTVEAFEAIKAFGGELGRYTRWQLPNCEPDLSVTLEDCRLTGWAVHALADAFLEEPIAPPVEEKLLQQQQDESGLSRTERKIRAIVRAAVAHGYDALCIPTGGKTLLMKQCIASWPELFGAGPDPFEGAWREAIKGEQPRLRMAHHNKFAGK